MTPYFLILSTLILLLTPNDSFAKENSSTEALKTSSRNWPFEGALAQQTYLTSSFAESRGMRYHAGWDYSTLQREGLELRAPEDGKITRVKVSPWGYGKVIYFQGSQSKKIYVMAHLSGFEKGPEIQKLLMKSKKNTLDYRPKNWIYKKGDILAYSGSSGIGSPHLHLEVRPNEYQAQDLSNYATHADTIAPILTSFALLSHDTFEAWPITIIQPVPDNSPEDSLRILSENMHNLHKAKPLTTRLSSQISGSKKLQGIALRLVDYSYHLGQNPMSIAEVNIKCKQKTYFSKKYDLLTFGKMDEIHHDHIWSRDDSLAGDWHWIPFQNTFKTPWTTKTGFNQCIQKNALEISIKDANSNMRNYQIILEHATKAIDTKFTNRVFPFSKRELESYFKGNQPWSHYTLLGQYFPNSNFQSTLNPMENQNQNRLQAKSEKGLSEVHFIRSDVRVDIQIDEHFQKVLQVELLKTRSLDNLPGDSIIWEWHPKGLATIQKQSKYCYQKPSWGQNWGLYYQTESSLEWIYYSNQTSEGDFVCTLVDELRDTRFLQDKMGPRFSNPSWNLKTRDGIEKLYLDFSIHSQVSFSSSNQLKAYLVNAKNSKELSHFIPSEWDHESHLFTIRLGDVRPKRFQGKWIFLTATDDQGKSTNTWFSMDELLKSYNSTWSNQP